MNKWQAKMRAEHRCTACGKADERTLAGKAYCTICAEKNRICVSITEPKSVVKK